MLSSFANTLALFGRPTKARTEFGPMGKVSRMERGWAGWNSFQTVRGFQRY
jgi:hypothetical protein